MTIERRSGPEYAPARWPVDMLWRQLEPLLPELTIEVVPHAESTNTTLLERARAIASAFHEVDTGPALASAAAQVRGSAESAAFGRRAADYCPCLLVAEAQTGGRGRQGRSWQSTPGASLTFSLGLRLRGTDWSGLSLAVGVALCEALAATSSAPAAPGKALGLKWPNDLWLMDTPRRGRKLGGILIETVSAGAQRLAVIGIGLNVAPWPASEGAPIADAADLRELDPDATPPGVLLRVALPLAKALQRFETQGFAGFAERYASLDVLRGQAVRTTHPEAAEGIASGVTASGELRVLTASGMKTVASGEVSVRLDGAAPA